MSVSVTFLCDRTGCNATESIPLYEYLYDEEADERGSTAAIEAVVPGGWAYEHSGLNDVLHCPKHVETKPRGWRR